MLSPPDIFPKIAVGEKQEMMMPVFNNLVNLQTGVAQHHLPILHVKKPPKMWEKAFREVGEDNVELTVSGIILFYPSYIIAYCEVKATSTR